MNKAKVTTKRNSGLMVTHLHAVEAVLGRRISPQELTSAKFTNSRDQYLKLLAEWQKQWMEAK